MKGQKVRKRINLEDPFLDSTQAEIELEEDFRNLEGMYKDFFRP